MTDKNKKLDWHRIARVEQLESTLSEALAHEGPSLVEISTDAELV